jgi:hypothetical protein
MTKKHVELTHVIDLICKPKKNKIINPPSLCWFLTHSRHAQTARVPI